MSPSMPKQESLDVDTAVYLSLDQMPARLNRELSIAISDHAYLPRVDDSTSDWVAHVATPAFKLVRQRRSGPVASFCSIGTGAGLDVLAAIETMEVTRVGLTDLHPDVVDMAVKNIAKNVRSDHPLVVQAGYGDLLTPLQPFRSRYDVIYENLPNVPLSDADQIGLARTSSTCLAPREESIPELIVRQMLDLHYLALVQAQGYLSDGGSVLSILGARVPLEILLTLGKLAGYKSSFLTYTWKVQADPYEIAALHAQKQQQGFGPFHFYLADVLREAFRSVNIGTSSERALELERLLLPERLDAVAAYAAMKRGSTIGHTVAVLESKRE